MPFMVSEGESGYLIDPEDTTQIADRMKRILGDDAAIKTMGRRGREIAMARFHPEAVAGKTRQVYRQLCGETDQGITSGAESRSTTN